MKAKIRNKYIVTVVNKGSEFPLVFKANSEKEALKCLSESAFKYESVKSVLLKDDINNGVSKKAGSYKGTHTRSSKRYINW